jgi:hypothetical protein
LGGGLLLNICFSAHAHSQLIERDITEEQVVETVLNPGQIPHLQGDLVVFHKIFMVNMKQYLFRVVAREDPPGGSLLLYTRRPKSRNTGGKPIEISV